MIWFEDHYFDTVQKKNNKIHNENHQTIWLYLSLIYPSRRRLEMRVSRHVLFPCSWKHWNLITWLRDSVARNWNAAIVQHNSCRCSLLTVASERYEFWRDDLLHVRYTCDTDAIFSQSASDWLSRKVLDDRFLNSCVIDFLIHVSSFVSLWQSFRNSGLRYSRKLSTIKLHWCDTRIEIHIRRIVFWCCL